MNLTVVFSLVSNVALFFMIVYFLFKIRPIKAAMIYHNKTQEEQDDAAEKMQQLNKAKEVLLDKEKRRQFDEKRNAHKNKENK